MGRIEIEKPAPDFTLTDQRGRSLTLSDFRGRKHVFLVFNRGFT
jgi:peroxiredoxin